MKAATFLQLAVALAGCGDDGTSGTGDGDADIDGDIDADADSDTGDNYDYPPPPYGVEVGTVIENLEFAGDGRIISMKDFHQDTNTRLLMIWGTAGW
jgi:hypothetical protein